MMGREMTFLWIIIMKLIISEEIIINGYLTYRKELKREDGKTRLLPSIIMIG